MDMEDKKKVLIVDDNYHIREVIRIMLADFGYFPILMANGKEALIHIKNDLPNLVITDYDFGGIWPNGIALARFARQECNIPVIMISANAEAEKLAMEERIPFFGKPFNYEKLIHLAKNLLKRG